MIKMIKLNPWWVTGITDAEGHFGLNYNSKNNKITASYKVTQKGHSISILNDLMDYYDCGNINVDNRSATAYKFIVNDIVDLKEKIIPHFDKYNLVGSKHLDYLDWKKAILLFSDRKENLNQILLIKSNMNKNRSYENRWNFLNSSTLNLKPEWIQAFTDGEGCFQCRIADTVSRNSKYVSVNPTFELAQNSHDIKVLVAIRDFFGVGYIKPKYNIESLYESKKSRSVSRLIINQSDKVIEFFDKYPLFTRKNLDYLDWKKILQLKGEGIHKTLEGKEEMLKIKKGMNLGRILNSDIFESLEKLQLSERLSEDSEIYSNSDSNSDSNSGRDSRSVNRINLYLKNLLNSKSNIYIIIYIILLFIINIVIIYINVPYEDINILDEDIDIITKDCNNINLDLIGVNLDTITNTSIFEEQISNIDNNLNENLNLNEESDSSYSFRFEINWPKIIEFDPIHTNMLRNLNSFFENGRIKIIDIKDENLDLSKISKIMQDLNLVMTDNIKTFGSLKNYNDILKKDDLDVSEFLYGDTSSLYSPSDSDINTEIVNLLQNGDNISIIISEGSFIDSISSNLSDNLSDIIVNSKENLNIAEEMIQNARYNGKKVVISTIPTDSPLALPSWHEVSKEPSKDDMIAWNKWNNNVQTQKAWAKKFPFLTEHYEQIKFTKDNIIKWAEHLQSVDNDIEKVKIVKNNESWMEETDTFNLDTLFTESTCNTDWMEETDTFDLDTLFGEDTCNTD